MIDPTNVNLDMISDFKESSNKRLSIMPLLIGITVIITAYYIINQKLSENETEG
jgi:hypothetical protein